MIFEMNVVFVKAAKTKGFLKLRVNDGEKDVDLIVSERDHADAGAPVASDNLTWDAFSILSLSDMRYRARVKAYRILEYGDNSELMLVMKLRRAGITREVAVEIARDMVMRGFVNDKRQLERLIINEVGKLQGPKRFIPKLVSKGYSRGDVEIVLDELLSSGEVDLDAAREKLLESAGELSYDERAKLLYKNGFSNT